MHQDNVNNINVTTVPNGNCGYVYIPTQPSGICPGCNKCNTCGGPYEVQNPWSHTPFTQPWSIQGGISDISYIATDGANTGGLYNGDSTRISGNSGAIESLTEVDA